MKKNPNKCRLLRVFEYMLNTDEEHPLNVTEIQQKLLEDGTCDKLPDRKSILRDWQVLMSAAMSWRAAQTIIKASI